MNPVTVSVVSIHPARTDARTRNSDIVLTNFTSSEEWLTAHAVDDWLKAEAELVHGHSSSDSNTP